MKIKVGITGQSGFIGSHLFRTINLNKEDLIAIPFEDSYFSDSRILDEWVKKCDVIIHLAAVNRHNDPEILYSINISLIKDLISSLERTFSTPHVIFASSIQEERDNMYGRSKKEGRSILELWAKRNNARFSGLLIPNVFGPFGNPFYNSVVATFCYQLTHDQHPRIDIDSDLGLIYIGELVNRILSIIFSHSESNKNLLIQKIEIEHTQIITVSNLLKKLQSFKESYFLNGVIPDISNEFDRQLFNTFFSFIDFKSFFPFHLKRNIDNRGSFVEIMRLNSGGQISFSTTAEDITRGNHYHTRKFERFAVIKGDALIRIRKIETEEIFSFELSGSNPSFVDMPIWYTHNIKNIGKEELYTIFWISEIYDPDDPDTYYEKV
jgi:UDP-2-acetamido-2,6-beta-L-arabino-hexul-4-ose reductase